MLIIEKHGGTIEFFNDSKKGTVVVFRLRRKADSGTYNMSLSTIHFFRIVVTSLLY